jgi:hypothetical protein
MMTKPCIDCDKKKFGCMCRKFEIWALDESLPEPILNLPKRIHKFNTPIVDTEFSETQKYTGGGRIAGYRNKRKEI